MADDWVPGALAAQDAYQPVTAPWLPDIGEPAIGSGGEFSPGVPAVNRFVAGLTAGRPPQDPNSPVVYHFAGRPVTQQYIDNTMDMGMAFSGGGLGIKAYHSSPHDFDRFDLSKIGTGEGAQVYGHGLYFAENPAVSGQGGQYWGDFQRRFSGPELIASERLRGASFDREKAIANVNDRINQAINTGGTNKEWMDEQIKVLQLLESDKPVGPRTYEVDINAEPSHMLDWDKRFFQQSPQVQDTLRSAGIVTHPDLTIPGHPFSPFGRQVYRDMTTPTGRNMSLGQAAVRASDRLNEAGIPGIKYLDEGSRLYAGDLAHAEAMARNTANTSMGQAWQEEVARLKKNPATHNYVVFDPRIVAIMKKYGLAGAAPVGIGALAAQDQYQQE